MTTKTPAAGYVYKRTQWANAIAFARCETPEELRRMTEELGYTQAPAAEIRKLIAWMNAENHAWGSGRAFKRVDWQAVFYPNHEQHPDYAARNILAEHDYYQSFA